MLTDQSYNIHKINVEGLLQHTYAFYKITYINNIRLECECCRLYEL